LVLYPRVDEHEQKRKANLNQGKRRCQRQIEQAARLTIDFDLKGGKAQTA
jgi:hypothetical protein